MHTTYCDTSAISTVIIIWAQLGNRVQIEYMCIPYFYAELNFVYDMAHVLFSILGSVAQWSGIQLDYTWKSCWKIKPLLAHFTYVDGNET